MGDIFVDSTVVHWQAWLASRWRHGARATAAVCLGDLSDDDVRKMGVDPSRGKGVMGVLMGTS